jgi:hypothetical protein
VRTASGRKLASTRMKWYRNYMTAAAKKQRQRTIMAPVTTMEELAIPSDAERTELIASLEAAESRIAAGQFVEHESDRFIDRLLEARASALSGKT